MEIGEELSNKEKILLKETNEFFATKGIGVEKAKIAELGSDLPKNFGRSTDIEALNLDFNEINGIIKNSDDSIKELWNLGNRDGFFKVKYKFQSRADFELANKLDINLGIQDDIYQETAKNYDAIMAGRDLQKQFDSGDFGVDLLEDLIKNKKDVHKFLDDAFPGKFTQEAIDTAKRTGTNKIRVTNQEADFFGSDEYAICKNGW